MSDFPVAAARPRIARRAVHGVLLVDKDTGVSSNAALQRVKRLFRAEKAGHTGTLDPLASGLLPICFGAATKLAQVALDADKRYLATLRLGVETKTGDAEGEVVAVRPVRVDRASVEAACAGFVGTSLQVPPMHSALKHEGRPLYDYARAGLTVERASRTIEIATICVVAGDGDRWAIDVCCSKGTYIRTLAEDIGRALGCGAHLAALRRTGCGTFSLDAAATLAELEASSEDVLDGRLLPVGSLVADWPGVDLEASEAARFLTGLRRRTDQADAAHVRVHGPDALFLGIGHVRAGELIADRLLSPRELGLAVPSLRADTPPELVAS